jgi:hypothetical protein
MTGNGGEIMELRDCPVIFHRSIGTWPPVWVRKGDYANEVLRGEIGTLKDVKASILKPYQRCFLIMEHDGAEYVGCLLFRNHAFCKDTYELLLSRCGQPMHEIGGIDVSAILRPEGRRPPSQRRAAALGGD